MKYAFCVLSILLLSIGGVNAQGDTGRVNAAAVGAPHVCVQFYPRHLERSGVVGSTTLIFDITTDGHTKNLTVVVSSGNDELDSATVTCASAWLYRPATANGTPVETAWGATVKWFSPGQPEPTVLLADDPQDKCRLSAAAQPRLGDSGVAKISYSLTDGSVSNVAIKTSSGDATLDQQAMTCVQALRFRSTTSSGLPATGDYIAKFDRKIAAQ